LKGSPVKALVTDIDMPGRINGWALAREVHSLLSPEKLVALNQALSLLEERSLQRLDAAKIEARVASLCKGTGA
jgi:hypothetical protein